MTAPQTLPAITHQVLILEAARWLQKKGCAVVITDMTHGGPETADAIGWHGTRSALIECKASRADYQADQKKSFRRCPSSGMGNLRYYCAMRGMLRADELPEGWGLLEWDGRKMREAKASAGRWEYNSRSEVSLLLSALRRVGQSAPEGVSVKCYTYETKNRATLGVETESEGE